MKLGSKKITKVTKNGYNKIQNSSH